MMKKNHQASSSGLRSYLNYALYMALAGYLSACGTMPRLVPDMALHTGKKIQIKDAQGPLSRQETHAILTKLKQESDGDTIINRHLRIEQAIGDTPLVAGNRVTLLKDGPPTYRSMFQSIDAAKSTINLETFTLEPDEIGQRLVDALTQKQRAGVQVNIIYDSVGSLHTTKDFFKSLSEAGGQVVEYNPINPLEAKAGWDINERDHRKLLVVDGKIAYVGGVNISSVYSKGSFGRFSSYRVSKKPSTETDAAALTSQQQAAAGLSKQTIMPPEKAPAMTWRDTHIMIQGPVVADFQNLFMETWRRQKGPTLSQDGYYPTIDNAGDAIIRAIDSTPSQSYNLIYLTLLSAINSAESEVYITNAYFIPDAQLLQALENAAHRGVDVRILLPSKTDSNLVLSASHSFYDELLANGVRIYERQDVLLHAKTALIDGIWSTVGSSNLDWRSFINNQEINAVVLGSDFGAQMQRMYAEDLKASKEIRLEAWRQRPWMTRLKERAARIWAKLL